MLAIPQHQAPSRPEPIRHWPCICLRPPCSKICFDLSLHSRACSPVLLSLSIPFDLPPAWTTDRRPPNHKEAADKGTRPVKQVPPFPNPSSFYSFSLCLTFVFWLHFFAFTAKFHFRHGKARIPPPLLFIPTRHARLKSWVFPFPFYPPSQHQPWR